MVIITATGTLYFASDSNFVSLEKCVSPYRVAVYGGPTGFEIFREVLDEGLRNAVAPCLAIDVYISFFNGQ